MDAAGVIVTIHHAGCDRRDRQPARSAPPGRIADRCRGPATAAHSPTSTPRRDYAVPERSRRVCSFPSGAGGGLGPARLSGIASIHEGATMSPDLQEPPAGARLDALPSGKTLLGVVGPRVVGTTNPDTVSTPSLSHHFFALHCYRWPGACAGGLRPCARNARGINAHSPGAQGSVWVSSQPRLSAPLCASCTRITRL